MIKSRFAGIIQIETAPDELWSERLHDRWQSPVSSNQQMVEANVEGLEMELKDAYQELIVELSAVRTDS